MNTDNTHLLALAAKWQASGKPERQGAHPHGDRHAITNGFCLVSWPAGRYPVPMAEKPLSFHTLFNTWDGSAAPVARLRTADMLAWLGVAPQPQPPCPACNGTALAECPECDGNGEVECNLGHDHDCDDCDGKGKIKCPDCDNGAAELATIVVQLTKGGPHLDAALLCSVLRCWPGDAIEVWYGPDNLSAVRLDCGDEFAVVGPMRPDATTPHVFGVDPPLGGKP